MRSSLISLVELGTRIDNCRQASSKNLSGVEQFMALANSLLARIFRLGTKLGTCSLQWRTGRNFHLLTPSREQCHV
jgi:hypothetical protein